jgi:tetratricopeptide (TPR) repeat protein
MIDDERQMVEWKSDLATDQQRSVVATFNTLFCQLEQDFPDTYDILRVLSFFDPEDIPLAMLTDGAQMPSLPLDQPLPGKSKRESSVLARITKWTHTRRRHSRSSAIDPDKPALPLPELSSLVSLILSPTAFPKALHKLQSLSFVEPLSHDGQSSLRMHDLVRFLTQEHVKRRPAYKAWLASAVSLVCSALRHVDDPEHPQSWPQCERLMPHIRSLREKWTGGQGVNLELVTADVRLARYLYSRGRYDYAERLCERSVEIFRKELGEKHRDTLGAFHILVQIYDSQGRFIEAEEACQHVLAVRKKELGADHQHTLATMNNLAGIYFRQNRSKEAERLFKQVLAVNEKALAPDHPDTLTTMHGLARVYSSQERYDEAEELHKHVLSRKEVILGPDDVGTLITAHNLANVYRVQRKYIHAEELYNRVLVGQEKQLGPLHPSTLTTIKNLASVYQSQTRYDEAERFYLRAFTGMKQQLGTNHPYTLHCATKFSDFYRSQGRNSEADALFLEGQ